MYKMCNDDFKNTPIDAQELIDCLNDIYGDEMVDEMVDEPVEMEDEPGAEDAEGSGGDLEAFNEIMLTRHNELRAAHGAPPVEIDMELAAAS